MCFASQIGVAFWLLPAGHICIWADCMFIAFLFSFWPLHVAYGPSLWHANFSEGVPGCSISYFYTCNQPGSQIRQCLLMCWMRCASVLGQPSQYPHHPMWILELCVHTLLLKSLCVSSAVLPHLPGFCFAPFCLQCAGEQSDDLPWLGQRSYKVCCLSDSGKWMLVWSDGCKFLSFQFSIVLHSDTQLHKIHCPVMQAPSSLPANVFLSS